MKKLLFILLLISGVVIKTSAQCWQSFTSGNYHTLAIKTDGTLWAWGTNSNGQLGDGTTANKLSPVQIGAGNTWKSVSAGDRHSIAVKSDGTLWTWGKNDNGQLGDGTNVSRSVPVQVGSATDWSSVGTGDNHSLAIKTDGTLWACGLNSNSQLGDGTAVDKNTFIQVGTGTNWKFVEGGEALTMAIQTNGTLWGFGYNSFFALGDGTTTLRPTPVQIGSATNWATVASGQGFSIGVKTDGTLWSWGSNFEGALGAGSTTSRSTPTQVGTATDWKAVGACYRHSMATKTDGTLWGCGYNVSGQLGDGTNVNKNVFTQAGIATNWLSPDAGGFHSMAIKSDGTIWGTGSNGNGPLGDGTNVSKVNPVQTVTTCSAGSTLHFDGANDYVRVIDNSSLNFGTGDFTVEANFKSTVSQPDYAGIVVKATTGTLRGWQLVLVNNRIAVEFGNGSGALGVANGLQGTTPLNDGNWHHLAMVVSRSQNQIRLYVDGNVEATVTNAVIGTYNITSTADMIIGADRIVGNRINGNIDEVRVWNTARTACELNTYKNVEIPGAATGLVANYHFNQGNSFSPNLTVTTLTNSSGVAGLDGTLNNFALSGTTSNWISPGSVANGYSTLPATPSGTTVVTNIACFGGNTGAINLTPTGGTGPYTFNWLPSGPTTEDRTNLIAGTYSVQVTDVNGCTGTVVATATAPTAPVSGTTVVTNVACFGGNTGAINLTPTGGTGPYTFNWLPSGPTTEDRTGLIAGTYSVQITDAFACTGTVVATPTAPTAPVSGTTVVTNIACFGGNTGAINLTPTGGTGPYTFNWLPSGPTTEDRTGLIAGTYSVQVTDLNGCVGTVTATVSQPTAPVSGTTVVTNVSCFGGSNGTINLTPTGGTGPYTFNWLPSGPTSEDRVNLVAGTYSVQITDANGCTGTTTVTVAQPTAPVSGTTVVTNVACFAGNTGAINLTPSGGTAPYTFNWVVGVTTEDRTNLTAGNYSVQITDTKGCTGGILVTVTQPAPVSGTTVVTNVACFGGNSGAINLTPTGGTGPYTFNWLPSGPTTEDRTSLIAGTYSVQITDANGCTGFATTTATVTQPTSPVSGTTVVTNVACFGGSNGAINLTASGGTPGYTYSWTDTAPVNVYATWDPATISGSLSLSNGNLTALTGSGFDQFVYGTVGVSSGKWYWENRIGTSTGSGSRIGVIHTGTGDRYTFDAQFGNKYLNTSGMPYGSSAPGNSTVSVALDLDNGTLTFYKNGVSLGVAFSGLPAGTYKPYIIDGSSFSGVNVDVTANFGQNTFTYPVPSGFNAGVYTTTMMSPTTEDRTGLAAGTYTVQITDANGCVGTITTTVTQPAAPLAGTTVVTNETCNFLNNGAIDLDVTGGTAPYTYNWDGGYTTEDISLVPAGTYSVIITDANGCTATVSATVTEPAQPGLTVTSTTHVSCFGGNNGAITVTPNGGTAPYVVDWADGPSGTVRTGLAAGTYSALVNDVNGCSSTIFPITITQPSAAVSGTTVVTNVSCFGGTNGAINLTPTGGTGPYTYNWLPSGPTTEDRTGLVAGTYSVQITDANACVTIVTATVTQPTSPVSGTTVVTNVSCFAGSNGAINLTPSGGTGPYTFDWGGGITTEDRTGLAAGTYSVIITDANSCTGNVSAVVGQPMMFIQPMPNVTHVSCFGGSNGAIDLGVFGGTFPYTFSWADGPVTEDRNNLTAGTYTVTITDANGCVAVSTPAVSEPAAVTSTLTVTECDSYTLNASTYTTSGTYTQVLAGASATGCDSTITLNLTVLNSTASTLNETACSSYTLNGTTYTASGTYTQTLVNAVSCDSTITLNLTVNQPTVSILNEVTCSSYTLNGTTYNTSGTYTQVLTNAAGCDSTLTLNLTVNQPTISTLNEVACSSYTLNGTTYNTSGTYTQTLVNASGCDSTITLNLTVNQPSSSTLTETACGSYTLNGTTYSTSGTYTQMITNAAGCDSTITLTLTINTIDVSVSQNDNVLTANAAGLSYQWIDCDNGNSIIAGETNQSFTAQVNGNYAVIVSDGTCSDTSVCTAVNTIGIKAVKNTAPELLIMPNPNNGNFTIKSGEGSYYLLNELGQQVMQITLDAQNNYSVTIEELSAGVYYLVGKDTSTRSKIVVTE